MPHGKSTGDIQTKTLMQLGLHGKLHVCVFGKIWLVSFQIFLLFHFPIDHTAEFELKPSPNTLADQFNRAP